MLYEPRIFWVLTCVVTVLTEACLLWFRYIIHMLFYFLINVFFIIQLLSSWVILSLYILDDSKSRWNLYRGWSANRFRAHRRVLDFSGNFLFCSSTCLPLNCLNTKTDLDDQQFFCKVYGVVPDILTFGKSIGNGFPLAAVVTTREIANCLPEYMNTVR